jgi:intein-encoded DNA endonuclease-like protein
MNFQEKAWYITGFADGEGSFNTSFRQRDDYLIGWKITPVFNISQKERSILALIKHHLKCGTLRHRSDHVWVYEVENQTTLREIIVPFFTRYGFLSQKKKRDFSRFQKILSLLETHQSKTYDDIVHILDLLDEIESRSSRQFTNQQILTRAEIFWKQNHDKIFKINQEKEREKNPQRLHAKLPTTIS